MYLVFIFQERFTCKSLKKGVDVFLLQHLKTPLIVGSRSQGLFGVGESLDDTGDITAIDNVEKGLDIFLFIVLPESSDELNLFHIVLTDADVAFSKGIINGIPYVSLVLF